MAIMHGYALVWLNIASEDLESAKLLHAHEKYAQATFYLQQCNEKLSKALLIEMGFIKTPNEPEEAHVYRQLFKVNLSEQDFGHRWHKKLIKTLEDSLHAGVSIESIVEEWEIAPHEQLLLTGNLADFQQRIDTARKIATFPDPPHQEVLETTKFCRQILRKLVEDKPKLVRAVSEVKMPNIDEIIKTAELKSKVKISKKYRKQIKKSVEDPESMVYQIITLSQMVLLLAVMSLYLVDHEVYARYPSPDFSKKYDPNLAVVGLFNELASVHDDIIAMITQE